MKTDDGIHRLRGPDMTYLTWCDIELRDSIARSRTVTKTRNKTFMNNSGYMGKGLAF
jgi:hypothetical protein